MSRLHQPLTKHPFKLHTDSLLLRMWLLACLFSYSPGATANDAVLLVHESKNEVANEVIHALSARLASKSMQVDLLDISNQPFPGHNALQEYTKIITLGTLAAARTLENNPPVPSLSLLLSKQSWSSFKIQNTNYARSVILLDQPYYRQLQLVRNIFGTNNNIGVILGPSSSADETELTNSAKQLQQKIAIKTIQSENELIPALRNLTEQADVLLAIPDAMVYNKHSVQGVLLLTYRNKTPVIGFSQAYTRAGAVVSLYSGADDIAHHTSDLINDKATTNSIYFPKYFSVIFNQQVARTLGITPPDANKLIENISHDETLRQ